MVGIRRRDLVLVLILAITATAFWLFRIMPAGTRPWVAIYVNLDLFTYYMPRTDYMAAMLRSSDIPLWNPYEMAGLPLIATLQCGGLYPLNFPYLLMPPEAAWFVTGLIHSVLAGICMYAFCRLLKIGIFGATVAALTFMLCSWSIGKAQSLPDQAQSTALMPLVFLCAEALLQRRSLMRCIWLGVALSLLFLAGEPEIFVRSSMLLGPYVLCRLAPQLKRGGEGWRSVGASVAVVGGAYLIFFGLTAAQWIPTYELANLSTRVPGALSYKYVMGLGAAPFLRQLLHLLSPAVPNTSIGLVGLALLILSPLCFRRRPIALFFAAVAILGFLLTLREATFLASIYYYLPTGSWFRVRLRLLIFFAFAAPIAAAFAADHIQMVSQQERQRPVVRRVMCAVVVVVGVVLLCLLMDATVQALIDRVAGASPTADDVSRYGLEIGRIIVAIFVLSCCALLLSSRASVRYAAQVVLCLLIIFDTTWRAPLTRGALPHHHYPQLAIGEPEVTSFVKNRAGTYRTYFDVAGSTFRNDSPAIGLMNRFFVLNGSDPLCPDRYVRFVEAMWYPVPRPSWTLDEVTPSTGHEKIWGNSPNVRLLDYFSVKYVVLGPKSRFFDVVDSADNVQRLIDTERYRFVHEVGDKKIYENLKVLPRVYVASDYRLIGEPAEIRRELTSPQFDPLDTVVLEKEPDLVQWVSSGGSKYADAKIREYEPERVVIDVNQDEGGFVVLSDLCYPGWKAFVDGAEVPVYRANYMFRAVAVPPGERVVTFLYEPRSFRVGAILSISTLIVLLIVVTARFVFSKVRAQKATGSVLCQAED